MSGHTSLDSDADDPGDRALDTWTFVRDFHARFLETVVKGGQTVAGHAPPRLAETIRKLASDDAAHVSDATTELKQMVHALFDREDRAFLKQFNATWGVVLLWDDFHGAFINTGGFTNFVGADADVDRKARRYRLASTLVDRQDVFRSRGFTEPMTDLIFRATVPPRPLVMRWARSPGLPLVPRVAEDSAEGMCLALDALNQDPYLGELIQATSAAIDLRLEQPAEHAEWLAERIQDNAARALDSSPAIEALLRAHYRAVIDEYGIKTTSFGRSEVQSTLQTLIWNRLFDHEWNVLYFIPTQLPGPAAVSGLVLACREELRHPAYTALLEIVNRVLSVFHFELYGYQKERFALQAAVTAIMARNMSHNIGSHVMPRARADQVRARLERLSPAMDEASRYVTAGVLRDRLDDYVQKKADFLSEITTDPLMSTRPAMFFQDVVLPFLQNPLLMDNLAANEGIRFEPSDGHAALSRLALKVQVRRAGVTIPISARFICEKPGCRCQDRDGGDAGTPGYTLRCPANLCESLVPRVTNSEEDVRIDLPGPLGEFAFYGFLENLVRNAAKHNRDRAQNGLTITIEIEDEDGDSGCYAVRIWDSLSRPAAKIDGVLLPEYLDGLLRKGFIDPTGQIRREAWGLKEMLVCASLLAGRRNFVSLSTNPPLTVAAEDDRVVFKLRFMRSRSVVAVLPEWPAYADSLPADSLPSFDALDRAGVRVFTGFDTLQQALSLPGGIRTGQFALIDVPGYGDAGRERDFGKRLRALVSQLPLRVLVFDPEDRLTAPDGEPDAGVLPAGVGVIRTPFQTTKEHWQSVPRLLNWLWSCWLERWLRTNGEPVLDAVPGVNQASRTLASANVHVFFQQTEELGVFPEPTHSWREYADRFNQANTQVRIYVAGIKGGRVERLNMLRGTAQFQVAYDRHGSMITGLRDLQKAADVSYSVLGKDSPDFVPLFSAALPAPDEPWLLPWELAEAGLMRVLVIDERIAEASYAKVDLTSDASHDLALQKWKESKLLCAPGGDAIEPWPWHVAWRAKVYVCTDFGFRSNCEPLHPSIADARAAVPAAPALSVVIDERAHVEVRAYGANAPAQAQLRFDAVLIHQGVLDNRCGGQAESCLAALHRDIGAVIVESGRGVPLTLPLSERFLPFSIVQHYLLGSQIGKLGLTRTIMSVARVGSSTRA